MLKNASKFKENFIIYLNSLAFSLQTSFINFKFFFNNEETVTSLLFLESHQLIFKHNFKHYS